MDLMPSEDQNAIQSTVRAFLASELPLDRVRKSFDSPTAIDLASIWRRAGELGFLGLGVAAAKGGTGFALTEEMVLFNELGRALAPGPWLGSVIAARCLEDEASRAAVLSGEVPCALADVGADDRVEIRGGVASGALVRVSDAPLARALLLRSGDRWHYIPRLGEWRIEAARSLDLTRPVYRLSFDGAECIEVASGAAAADLTRVATILCCAEAVGGIEKTVEMSVEYCKVRTQFDRPIGAFQAIKHRCADMAVRAEMARAATIYATVHARDGDADAEQQVAMAKLLCGEAYLQNVADNIQNHGGMGFTWECDAHLYLRRAHGFDLAFGSRRLQLDRLVAELRGAPQAMSR